MRVLILTFLLGKALYAFGAPLAVVLYLLDPSLTSMSDFQLGMSNAIEAWAIILALAVADVSSHRLLRGVLSSTFVSRLRRAA